MLNVAVVIPVFNRKDTTLRCLDSLLSANSPGILIIVVDSGSTDGTREAIHANYPQVRLLETGSESWWAAATNLGVREAIQSHCKYILTYNDDNVATSGLVAQLVESAQQHPYSIISSVVCSLHNPDTVLFAGRKRAHITDRFYFMNLGQPYGKLHNGIREVDLLHGTCTLFPASVFSTVGFFDEAQFPHLFADNDLELKAKKAGYRLLVDLDAVVLNEEEKTGINPYGDKAGLRQIRELLFSRKSAFQIKTRTLFLWRHRRNVICFILSWIADYSRLLLVISLRWLLTEKMYKRIENYYLQNISA